LQAQDYIYSVTVGTSWARQEFPAQERAQRKLMAENNKTIAGMPPIAKTFMDFEYDFRKYNTYNDSIFFPLSHQEWIDMFKRRSLKYSQFYSKNNRNIAMLKDYFVDSVVPEAAYDSLYYWTRHLLFRNTNDIFMYETLMDILLPHYEEIQDVEHLMFCYLCSGMYNFQCSRMGDKDSELRSELYFHKMMNLADRFASFKDPLNRYYLISAFVNLVVLHAQSGNVSLQECQDLANSMKRIYADPASQTVLKGDSLLNEYAKWSIDVFRFRGIFNYISQGRNLPELRDQLYQSYCDVRKEVGATSHLKNRYYARLEYDDLLVEAFMGNITWDKAFEIFAKMLAEEPDFKNKTDLPTYKINYTYNLSESYITLLEHTSFSREKKGRLMKDHIASLLDIISRYEHNKYPFEKGKILSNIACNPKVLQYLSEDEKNELIFKLIVVEQPVTFVHVMMCADLTRILAEAMVEKKPGFFIGVPGYQTEEDVKANKEKLVELCYRSAIYHDLGKISMPTVIENSFRRLTDHEFDIIKMHPEKSRQFFAAIPSLKPYQDVALGHHKWFDGDGYPASFKNRKSPYFPVLCIVALCDCMDAATENIGRNYHTPKSFEKVMDEFNSLAGEQFHPALVNFIMDEPEVYAHLKQVVSDGRYDNYFKLYQRYMNAKK